MAEPWPSIAVTQNALDALFKTRPWVLWLGVLSVVVSVLCGLGAIGGLFALMASPAIGIMVLIEAGISLSLCILFAVWQLRYAQGIKTLATSGSTSAQLENVLCAQRSLWKLMGIVMLVFTTLAIVFSIFSFYGSLSEHSSLWIAPH